jgi:hypothetical protein
LDKIDKMSNPSHIIDSVKFLMNSQSSIDQYNNVISNKNNNLFTPSNINIKDVKDNNHLNHINENKNK